MISSALPRSEAGLVVCVVGVLDGDVPHGGLGLRGDELQEVVDLEGGLRRVLDAPHDDGGQLDRVAVGVVDLEDGRLVVAYAGRDLGAGRQRVHPAQAVLADRAPVAAEELDDAGLARRHHVQPAHREERGYRDHDAEDDQPRLPARRRQ